MNKIFLKGNVGHDPRITTFEGGGKVAQFTLATTEKGFTTKDGREIPDETTWHNIVVKRTGLAGICEQYVKKGSPLLVVGRVTNRKYTGQDGTDKFITEIIVEELELLGGGQKRDEAPAPDPEPERIPYGKIYESLGGGQPAAQTSHDPGPATADFIPPAPVADPDNDLPF